MEEILVVDGYNVIGATKTMGVYAEGDFEAARDWLIEKLAEYQGYTGIKVYLVFDAHMVPGIGKKYKQKKINIIFTRKNETADERIERLVQELKRVQRSIYVATSDHTEQRVIFGQGALRKSARELVIELQKVQHSIDHALKEKYREKPNRNAWLNEEMAEIFEKWRREK